jgi:hypothetical protein
MGTEPRLGAMVYANGSVLFRPGRAVPGRAVPGGAVPGRTVPGRSVPGRPVPGQPFPGQPFPGQTKQTSRLCNRLKCSI